MPYKKIFVQFFQRAFMSPGDVNQHVDQAKHRVVVADDWYWKRQDVDANPVRALGYCRPPAYGMLGVDGDSHGTLVMRKEVACVSTQPPCNVPAIMTGEVRETLMRYVLKIDAGRMNIPDNPAFRSDSPVERPRARSAAAS
jgi:hypothetical protein